MPDLNLVKGFVVNFQIETKGKFLFLLLSSVSLVLLMILTTVLWWFISPRLHDLSFFLATGILSFLRVFYLIIILGIIILFLECYSKISIKIFYKLIRFSITFLFPINILLGKFLHISRDKIRESFVNVNNSFIKIGKQKFNPNDILVLLPHCLQNYDCSFRVTNNINNCIDCGKCKIMDLKRISKDYHINIAIATGGTLARKIIVQTKPKCIIAVACQRDLVDGLLEVFPIPVYGVLNERPFGPCINTTVDVQKIEDFLKHIIA